MRERGERWRTIVRASTAYSAGTRTISLYTRMPSGTVEVAVGFPVSAEVTSDGDVTAFELPGGRVATGIHVGSYESLEASYHELMDCAAAEGHMLA